MDVVRFDQAWAATVAGWSGSALETRAWCSRDHVDAATIIEWAAAAGTRAYAALDGDRPVAYGELWIDHDEAEVELAHLIVRPDRRGEGIGRRFVVALTEIGFAHHPTVAMRVVPDNEAALHCYRAAGFDRATASEEGLWNAGQPVAYAWMLRAEPAPGGYSTA